MRARRRFFTLRSFEHVVWLLEQTKKVLGVYNDKVYDKYDRYSEANRPLGHRANRFDKLGETLYEALGVRQAFRALASQ